MAQNKLELYTIGHSTRSLEEMVEILKSANVGLLVDVRTVPRSRHTPQFNKDRLQRQLPAMGIEYRHLPELGGFRQSIGEASPNTGWRNKGFRGFADYMLTDAFTQALNDLIQIAREQRAAIMCAEAVPWRCHRSLIADALLIRGIQVQHLMGVDKAQSHELTSFAKVDGESIVYPG